MRKGGRGRLLAKSLLAVGALVGILLQPGIANAATITVTTTDDVSATDCTLRDAITAANTDAVSGQCSAGSGTDQIDITATGTINLGSALPNLTTNMAIDGPGVSSLDVHRQSGGDYAIFTVTNTGVVTISDLTVSNGRLTGLVAGGGIRNFGTATLDRVRVTANSIVATSDTVNPAPGGGGIFNGGVGVVTMTLRRSTVIGNTVTTSQTATSGQTSADAIGGGIYNTGTLAIERSTVTGNTVSASVASTDPGASAFSAGAAMSNHGTIVLKLSTLSGNEATATATDPATETTRGAIYNLGSVTVTGSTLAFNTGANSANLSAQGAETVTSSIISNPLGGPNCDGSINTDGAFNIVSDATCVGLGGTPTDPLLQPLDDNGGATQTHELESASPALDAGTSSGETTDQREVARPVDLASKPNASDGSDVGAVEMQVLDTTPPNNPTTLDSPSHDPGVASNDPIVHISWSGASDAGSGVDGFSFQWDTSSMTVPDTTKDLEEDAGATNSPPLADGGSHWFHLRTRDNAGNWSSAVHLGPFVIDTGAPVDPVVDSPSHDPNAPSADPTVDVTWSGASDAGSGVDGFSFVWDTSPTTVPDTTKDAEETVAGTTSPSLADGNHWFHLRTRDNAGNWTSTAHFGPLVIDTGAPETLITKQPKKKIATDRKRVRVRFEFTSNEPGATFLCRLDNGPSKPCTSPTAFKVKRGKHQFSMQALDRALNPDLTPALRRFKVVPRN